ncbi:uncharacterized protein LOC124642121 [Helicoverpa zea]|uniref:uncharacterized protein LOC124642121 n=1 Tax=Helicoverpa zea TaxID=7113 RepID=UPI001F5861DE|nr:uncharacterized protein LOC124642121 [Helicoverpa zea]
MYQASHIIFRAVEIKIKLKTFKLNVNCHYPPTAAHSPHNFIPFLCAGVETSRGLKNILSAGKYSVIMGKRKRERSKSEILRKIRRLERKLRSSSSSSGQHEEEHYSSHSRSRTPDSRRLSLYSDDSEVIRRNNPMRSEVVIPNSPSHTSDAPIIIPQGHIASSNDAIIVEPDVLPPEILEALGDSTGKEEILGPPINEEISKRWGRILVEGLTREAKEAIMKATLTPENFTLSKAPKLNLEMSAVISDSIKHRDKLLEKAQNQLGLGIAGLGNLASSLIKDDQPKMEILKKLSDVSRIFLDLHYENSQHRRKLITSALDKKFTATMSDLKRDSFLFGTDLGEKIKATKTAEKSGLQIKRNNFSVPSTSRQQGNWRGPPRFQSTKGSKPGGQKPRYTPSQGQSTQQGRRQPASNRAPPARKTDRTRRNH